TQSAAALMHSTTQANPGSSCRSCPDCQLSPGLRSPSGAPITASAWMIESLSGPQAAGASFAFHTNVGNIRRTSVLSNRCVVCAAMLAGRAISQRGRPDPCDTRLGVQPIKKPRPQACDIAARARPPVDSGLIVFRAGAEGWAKGPKINGAIIQLT